KAVALLLGDGTFALRLVPFLASCAALVGIVGVARRVLRPEAVPWVVLLFACSDRLLWPACGAKPYAVDVLVAVGLLVAWTRCSNWPLTRQLLLYTALSPLLIFLAYPACFLLGGLALSLTPAVFRDGRPRIWLLHGAFLTVLCGSFLLLLVGP